MRKDVKIGAIVAGVLVAGFLVYVIVNSMSGPEETVPPPGVAGDASTGDTNIFETTGGTSLTGDTSAATGDTSSTADLTGDTSSAMDFAAATPTAGDTSTTGDTVASTGDTIRPTYGTGAAATATVARVDPAPPPPARDTTASAWWGTSDTAGTSGVSGTSGTSGTGGTTSLTASAQRTYVIQPGDTYSSIAEREYGKAALFKTIRDANPTVPPKKMMPGKTIVIPPKPDTAVAAGTTGRSALLAKAGTLDVDPATGKRYYVVKATDSRGYWGIAGDIYGHGKYHNVLADANPGVNPGRLQAGMKLWAPERVADAAAGAVSTAPPPASGGPPRSARLETGAPARAVLADGRVFD